MHKYRLIGKKGEGTFSEVLKAQCIKNGKYVAIKCMKNHFDSLEQVNNLREIQALRRLSPHPGIIKLCEVLYDQPTGRLALVFELMDMNIYELIRGRRHYLPEARLKDYMYQLLKSMDHMHRNGIFHRDIKPENILVLDDELKLADFGSCRGIYSKQPYTEYISTRWYRAPECLLTDGFYNYKMDMWGVGCVMFEVLSLYPLFPGTNELDQINKIHNVIGTPPPDTLAKLKKHSNSHIDFNFPHKEGSSLAKLIPHISADCVELITKLLAYDPDDRISARQAVKHPYFRELREAEKRAAAEKAASAGGAGGEEEAAARTSFKPSKGGRKAKVSDHSGHGHGAHSGSHSGQHSGAHSESDAAGESSCLPSIGGGVARTRVTKAQRKLDDHSDDDGGGQAGGSVDDDDPGGMLPRIGGQAKYGGGVASLKIDSKSLLSGQKAERRAAGMQKLIPTAKKPGGLGAGGLHGGVMGGGLQLGGKPLGGVGGPGMGGLQSGMHQLGLGGQLGSMQTRSLDKFGNSALGQPALGALGLGGSGQHHAITGKKSYMSPYSQRKTKV